MPRFQYPIRVLPYFFTLCCCLFWSQTLVAQTWDWAAPFGNSGDDEYSGLLVDSDGSIYITGQFNDTLILGADTLVNVDAFSSDDAFIAKLDSSHNVLWSQHIRSTLTTAASAHERVSDIAFGPAGDVYVVGDCFDQTIFGDTSIIPPLATGPFLARYTPAGQLVWVRDVGASATVVDLALVTDDAGSIFVAGGYTQSTVFEGQNVVDVDGIELFVARYDTGNVFHWVEEYVGQQDEYLTDLAIDADGNLTLTGHFSGGLAQGTAVELTAPGLGGFVLQLDSLAQPRWSHTWGITGISNFGRSVSSDLYGNVWLSGQFSDSMQLGHFQTTGSLGFFQGFVAKLLSDGTVDWVNLLGNSSNPWEIVTDASGNALVSNTDEGIEKLDPLGNQLWLKSEVYEMRQLALAPSGKIYVAGLLGLGGTTFLDTFWLTNTNNDKDFFLARLVPPIICLDTLVSGLVASGPTQFCLTDSVTLSADPGYSSYQWSQGPTTQVAQAKTSGPWYCVITDSTGCTGASPTIQLAVSPDITLQLSGPTTFCSGDSLVAAAPSGPYSYNWHNSSSNSTITLQNSGQAWVQITDTAGCIGTSDTLAINVLALPVIGITADTTQFCLGDSAILTADSGMATYQWSTGSTTQATSLLQTDSAWITVTDTNGCTNTLAGLSVTALDTSIAIQQLSPVTFCMGDSAVLAIDGNLASYSWMANGTYAADTIAVLQTDTIVLSGIRNNGCSATSLALVIAANSMPIPLLSTSDTNVFCDGNSATYTTTISYDSVQWNGGSSQPSVTITQTGQVHAQVWDNNGCTASSDTAMITVWPLPQPTVSANGDTALCPGDSLTISSDSIFAQYAWMPAGTTNSVVATAMESWQLTATDANGCMGISNTIEVTWFDTVVTITPLGATTFCEAGSVQLDATPGFSTYEWSTGQTGSSISVDSSVVAGLVVTNPAGCTGTATAVTITAHPAPMPTIVATGDTTFCDGDSVLLATVQPYSQYNWVGSATSQQIVVFTSNLYNTTVTDGNGCTGVSNSTQVTANPLPPQPVIGFNQSSNLLTSSETGDLQWYFNGALIDGATASLLTPDSFGIYTVSLTSAAGCTVLSDTFNHNNNSVDVLTPGGFVVRMAPNPTTSAVVVSAPTLNLSKAEITIVDALGRLLPIGSYTLIHGESIQLDLSNVPHGIYFLTLNVDGRKQSARLVVN